MVASGAGGTGDGVGVAGAGCGVCTNSGSSDGGFSGKPSPCVELGRPPLGALLKGLVGLQ